MTDCDQIQFNFHFLCDDIKMQNKLKYFCKRNLLDLMLSSESDKMTAVGPYDS